MRITNRAFYECINGYKVPRKIKKAIIGTRIPKSKLRRMLKETKIVSIAKTMYDEVIAEPHGLFCPHCGCKGMIGGGNMAEYPEHWERFRCLRCQKVVAYIDNSPFVHALEFKDYNPEF